MLVPSRHNRISSYDEPQHPQALDVAGGGGGGLGPVIPGAAELPQRGLVEIVWRRRWIVAGLALVAVVAGFVYVQNSTPIYASSSRIYVEQNGPRILSDVMGPARQGDSYIYAQAEVIQSTPIVSKALESVNAARFKTFATTDNALVATQKQLKVEVGKKDDLITVSFESPYPEEAAQVVNALVQSYMDTLGVNQKSTSIQMLDILRKEKEKRDAELKDVTDRMVKYKEQHNALAFEYDKNNITMQKLSRLSDQLNQAQLDAAAARAEYASIIGTLKDPAKIREFIASRQVKDMRTGTYASIDREVSDLRTKLQNLEWELGVYMRNYGENHPTLQNRAAAIEQIRMKIAALDTEYAQAFVNQAKEAAEIAAKKVDEVQVMYEAAKSAAIAFSSDAIAYDLLENEMKRLDRACELLDTKIRELALTAEDANIGRMKAQILDVARPADLPAKPKKAMILAAALMMGLMFGCGSALAADWMDQRLRSVEEVRLTLGTPVLGVVPHMKSKRGAVACGQAVALEPMSETAEAYRTIRTAVYFGTPDGESKKLLITSPSPGDGKSTLASNLAIAMAKAGQRVVLLDCDFRRPTQHKVFEIADAEAGVGLSSVVAGQARVEEAVRPAAAVEGLDILPCGPIPPNPAELLNSQAFADLLDRLAETYDHVLIDAPPVLAVTDARIIAAICDQTILVLRAEKSTRNLALAARDGLLSVGGQILGVVVNDVPRARRGDGYAYSYGYYRYGYYGRGELPAASAGPAPAALVAAVPAGARRADARAVHQNGASMTDAPGEVEG